MTANTPMPGAPTNLQLSIGDVIASIEGAIGVIKGPCQLGPDVLLVELQLDSLDVLEVIMQLEAEYGRDLHGLDLVKGLQPDGTIRDLASAFIAIAGPQQA